MEAAVGGKSSRERFWKNSSQCREILLQVQWVMTSLRCYDNSDCNPDVNKSSSLSNTTVVAIFPNLCLCSNLGGIDPEKLYRATLKGHSQLWDRANLDTSFTSLKGVYLNPNQMHASDTSRNLLQSCLLFHSILDLL